MDGKPPTYEDLLDLTRWQARQIDKLRADVERLLGHDEVGATNSLAEREGRPAVIARKLSTGNRTEAGAETHAVLASVFRTYRYQCRDILQAVVELFQLGPGHVLELDHTASPVPAL
jgi:hypothetical protein